MSEAARQSPAPADAQKSTSVLSVSDQEALRHAVATLENPSLVARFSNFAGRPVELIGHVLPRAASKIIARASRAALRSALRLALTTLPNVPAKRGCLIHKVLAATSGALGGAVGIVSLPLELPIATTLILRSIAEIAQGEGEDLASPEVALACVQVFALGGWAGRERQPGREQLLCCASRAGPVHVRGGPLCCRAGLCRTGRACFDPVCG